MSSLTEILTAARSADQGIRQQAEAALENASTQNIAGFLTALCEEMSAADKPRENRMVAGLVLKNTLCGKANQDGALIRRWQGIDIATRRQIRQVVLMVLGSQFPDSRKVAALIVAKIAAIEMPAGEWDDLIPRLISSMTTNESAAQLWESTFMCLNYICEEGANMPALKESLKKFAPNILGVIKDGVEGKFSGIEAVQASATKALYHTLDIVDCVFSQDNLRDIIVKNMICKMCAHKNEEIRLHAYMCLCELAANYYEYLGAYMGALFQLTQFGMTEDGEQISKQSIEFWSLICEIESDIIWENSRNPNDPKNRKCQNYVQTAGTLLAPAMLKNMIKEQENVDSDEWTVQKAASICLQLMSETLKQQILPLILPFVEQNINHTEWHRREAAILTFGLVLSGPPRDVLLPLATEICPLVVQNLQFNHDTVKDTAVWTLGRMFKLVPSVISDNERLEQMIQILVKCLGDKSLIAFHVCWSLNNIAENCCGAAAGGGLNESQRPNQTHLSRYMKPLILSLLQRADKPDAMEHNLLNSCYETINALIENSGRDDSSLVVELLVELINRLKVVITTPSSADDVRKTNTISNLCSVIGTAILRVPSVFQSNNGIQKADQIIALFIQVLKEENSIMQEETLLAIGPVVGALGSNFSRYVTDETFMNLVLKALKNGHEQSMLCKVATGLIGDIASKCSDAIRPHCDEIVKLLLQCLMDDRLLVTVKPVIISCIADIALAVRGDFDRYLNFVMPLLFQAGTVDIDGQDEEIVETIYHLRESVIETCSSILRSLQDGSKHMQFINHIEDCLKLVGLILSDPGHPFPSLTVESLRLVVDVVQVLGTDITIKQKLANNGVIHELCKRCLQIPETEGERSLLISILAHAA